MKHGKNNPHTPQVTPQNIGPLIGPMSEAYGLLLEFQRTKTDPTKLIHKMYDQYTVSQAFHKLTPQEREQKLKAKDAMLEFIQKAQTLDLNLGS